MDRDITNIINLSLNTVNFIVLFVIIFLTIKKIEKSLHQKNFLILLFIVFLFNLSDCSNWVCEGLKYAWNVPALHFFTFLYFLVTPLMYIAFMRFIRNLLGDNYINNKFYILCLVPCILSIIGAYISCYPGFLYEISRDNFYSRSRYHILHIICIFIFFVFCVCYIVSKRHLVTKKDFITLLSFPTLPTLSYVPQMFCYGIATVNIGLVASMVLLYVNLNKAMQEGKTEKIKFNSEYFQNQDNISFVEKVKRFACSYGFSENAIESIKDELQLSEIFTLKIITAGVFLITLICFILSFLIVEFANIRYVELFFIVLNGFLEVILFLPKKRKGFFVFLGYLVYIFMCMSSVYIYLAVMPDKTPLALACTMLVAPAVFCYMPYITFFLNFSTVFVYIDLSFIYRLSVDDVSDNISLVFITALGVIIGYGIAKSKITSIYLTKNLDNEVAVKTKQLNAMSKEIISTLTSSIESKDEYTNGHSERVADYAVLLAKKIGWSEKQCDELWMEAILHDVGKIGVTDNILKKSGKLTDEEFKIIQGHTLQGARILDNLSFMPNAKDIAEFHHEKVDGSGYPRGLKENEIPASARIVAIADAYDAMTSDRCYRPALDDEFVMEELRRGRGTQFDVEFIDIFLQLLEEHSGTLIQPVAVND